MHPVERFLLLAFGSAAGAYLCMRFQFGFKFSPLISEELFLIGIVAVISLLFVVALQPISRLIEHSAPPLITNALVPVVAILFSICIGLWIYVGFLPRSLSLVLSRDWPFVLSFGFMGLGYAVIYVFHLRN